MKKTIYLLAAIFLWQLSSAQDHRFLLGITAGPGAVTIQNPAYYGNGELHYENGYSLSSGVQAEIRLNPVVSFVFNPGLQYEINKLEGKVGADLFKGERKAYAFSVPVMLRFSGGEKFRVFGNLGVAQSFLYATNEKYTVNGNDPAPIDPWFNYGYEDDFSINLQFIFGGGVDFNVADNIIVSAELRDYFQPQDASIIFWDSYGSRYDINKFYFLLGVHFGF